MIQLKHSPKVIETFAAIRFEIFVRTLNSLPVIIRALVASRLILRCAAGFRQIFDFDFLDVELLGGFRHALHDLIETERRASFGLKRIGLIRATTKLFR